MSTTIAMLTGAPVLDSAPHDTMPCSRCQGSGLVALPPELQTTLDFVCAREWTSAADLLSAMPRRTASAANNRLEALRALGLVERARHGRKILYRAVRAEEAPGVST